MSDSYRRTSETQWEWQQGNKTYGVRIFARTGSLVWSGWVSTPDGPLFDDGTSQTFAQFLEHGPALKVLPDGLADELRAAIETQQARRRWPWSRR